MANEMTVAHNNSANNYGFQWYSKGLKFENLYFLYQTKSTK
jgi:hypothetical protein